MSVWSERNRQQFSLPYNWIFPQSACLYTDGCVGELGSCENLPGSAGVGRMRAGMGQETPDRGTITGLATMGAVQRLELT